MNKVVTKKQWVSPVFLEENVGSIEKMPLPTEATLAPSWGGTAYGPLR